MKRQWLVAALLFLAGTLFVSLGVDNGDSSAAPRQPASLLHADTQSNGYLNFAPLVRKVKPAVVKVISESLIERRSVFGDDFLDRFFNAPRRRERVSGLGSGFFISADGEILTNYHVVKDAVKVKIVTMDEKEYTARTIGTDAKSDLALLKVEGNGFTFINLGDSNRVEVGEWVLAIGNPLGQDLSVTSGIVSAKGRALRGLEVDYQNFIQTDAAINQGNSGGPLVNMQGEAIGINSVILSPSGGNIGIGFAVPSNMAKKVINDLKREGRVVRGYLGVQITEITDAEAKDFDLPQGGVLVAKVEPGTPAEKAGLKRYDLIVKMNDREVRSANELRTMIANLNPGDTVNLSVFRNGLKSIRVTVGEAPDTITLPGDREGALNIDLGMVLVDNNPGMTRRFNLRTSRGIVVTEVDRGGVAQRNGIRVGDVILALNRTEVEDVDHFRELLAGKEPGSSFFLYINRAGEEYFVRFRLPDSR